MDDQALEVHIQAVSYRAKAEVCALHNPDFKPVFELRFKAWAEKNSESLAAGPEIAKARGMDGPKPPSIAAFARMEANLLAQLPEGDRARRCGELLASLGDASSR